MSSSSKVQLYMYDLSGGMAASMSLQLTGKYIPAIWHTSIVAHDEEIFYGQGVQRCRPGTSHHGLPLKTLDLGETQIDRETFHEYLTAISEDYTAEKYHLLEFNCNNFTNDVAGFLTSNSIPQEIIDLPKEFLSTPFGASLRPMIDNMFRRGGAAATVPPALQSTVSSNPVLQNALDRVSEAAQRGSVTPSRPITSGMTITTNMPSFQTSLMNNNCVAAMFTADWCGPCKMVKPIFEQLSHRTSNESPIAFLIINESTGREVIEYNRVTAFPTFKFYLKGEEVHQIRGADANELRTQIAILGLSGYPQHPHLKLPLQSLRNLSPSPVTFAQAPNFEAALIKLEKLTAAETRSSASIQLLRTSIPQSASQRRPSGSNIRDFIRAAHSLLDTLAPENFFPLLDLIKYFVLDDQTAVVIAEEDNVVLQALSKAVGSTQLRKPTLLTLLRLLCNSLSTDILASSLMSRNGPRSLLNQVLVKALLDSDTSVRACAGSLAYSVSGWLRKQRKEWTDPDAEQTSEAAELADFEMEMCSAVVEALDREEAPEVVHRLTAALGNILYCSSNYNAYLSGLIQALDGKGILQRKQDQVKLVPEALKLAKEVSTLCELQS